MPTMAKHIWSYRASSQLRLCAAPTCKQWKGTELEPWPPKHNSEHQHSVVGSLALQPALLSALARGIVTAPGLPQPAEPNVAIWWVWRKGKPFNYPARKGELVNGSCCSGVLQQGREISHSPQCCCDELWQTSWGSCVWSQRHQMAEPRKSSCSLLLGQRPFSTAAP